MNLSNSQRDALREYLVKNVSNWGTFWSKVIAAGFPAGAKPTGTGNAESDAEAFLDTLSKDAVELAAGIAVLKAVLVGTYTENISKLVEELELAVRAQAGTQPEPACAPDDSERNARVKQIFGSTRLPVARPRGRQAMPRPAIRSPQV